MVRRLIIEPTTTEMLKALELVEDLQELDTRPVFFEACAGMEDPDCFLTTYSRSWLREDGAVLAIVGCNPVAQGVGDVWAYLSYSAVQRPMALSRFCREVMTELWEILALHRIQAVIDCNHPKRLRFAQHLGFEVEGIARKHILKRDHWIVSQVER